MAITSNPTKIRPLLLAISLLAIHLPPSIQTFSGAIPNVLPHPPCMKAKYLHHNSLAAFTAWWAGPLETATDKPLRASQKLPGNQEGIINVGLL
ncbi:MAG: hypothetical protein VYA34_02995 [Myxococcota bacterium]|nr:hypothetical protein [Myxococcota bacterium]